VRHRIDLGPELIDGGRDVRALEARDGRRRRREQRRRRF
jgi:hypothetical protein